MSLFGLTVFAVSMIPAFDKPKWQKVKGLMFLFLGISAGIAMVHMSFFP